MKNTPKTTLPKTTLFRLSAATAALALAAAALAPAPAAAKAKHSRTKHTAMHRTTHRVMHRTTHTPMSAPSSALRAAHPVAPTPTPGHVLPGVRNSVGDVGGAASPPSPSPINSQRGK